MVSVLFRIRVEIYNVLFAPFYTGLTSVTRSYDLHCSFYAVTPSTFHCHFCKYNLNSCFVSDFSSLDPRNIKDNCKLVGTCVTIKLNKLEAPANICDCKVTLT